MGGNNDFINRSTGEIVASAVKIPLNVFGKSFIKKEVLELLKVIDTEFKKKYKTPIWKDFSIVTKGYVFNGSTSSLMDDNIGDDEFTELKPMLGDIDVVIDKNIKDNLFNLLAELEGKQLTKTMKYIGNIHKESSSVGNTIITGVEIQKDGTTAILQIDWELGHYENDEPTEYARFGHSSSWDDIKASKFTPGLKGGMSHKLLLRALFGGASLKKDAVIVTDKSTPEKPKVRLKGGKPLELRMLKFSVDLGVRNAYLPFNDKDGNQIIIDGKKAFIEDSSSSSSYETNVETICRMIFPIKSSNEVKNFWSFIGVVDLMKKYLDSSTIEMTMKRFIDNFFDARPGKNIAQPVEPRDSELDKKIKTAAVNYIFDKISSTSTLKKYANDKVNLYYTNFNTNESVLHGRTFKKYISQSGILKEEDQIRSSYLILNGKKGLEISRDEDSLEIKIKDKTLEDSIARIMKYLKTLKMEKYIGDTGDYIVYNNDSVEIMFSEFKGNYKALMVRK